MKRITILTLLLLSLFLGSLGAAAADTTHIVQSGETLSVIAATYGSSVQAIANANGILNPNTIYAGQYLTIPGQGSNNAPAKPAAGGEHIVQAGDTLYRLAWRYNTTIQALIDVNTLANPNALYVGQVLLLPGDGSAETPAATATPAYQAIPAPTSQPEPTGQTTHVVQFGESLSAIARRYNVYVYEIVDANNLTSAHLIYAGQTLIIPGTTAVVTSEPAATATPAPLPTGQPAWTPEPTVQPEATSTPAVTAEATLPPTLAPVPTAVPTVDVNTGVAEGGNLLKNGSFEEGHYNHNGMAELQVPNHWRIEWLEGESGFDQPWFTPETRVLSKAFLPPHEHAMFIYDGDFTIKAFKGYAPINFSFLTEVYLEPGVYEFSINVYPDMVADYSGGKKTYAGDPRSAEVRLIADGSDSGWQMPRFGDRNTMTFRFNVDAARTVTVGANMQGRYGLVSNGFFMDNWSLRAVR